MVQDGYTVPNDQGDTSTQVSWKLDIVKAQLQRALQYITAAGGNMDAQSATLFITFVSGTRAAATEIVKSLGNPAALYTSPQELALGNNCPGVNAGVVTYLAQQPHYPGSKAQFGIVSEWRGRVLHASS